MLYVRDIEQFYCKERVQRGEHGTQMTYALWVSLKGGRHLKLLAAGNEPDQALFLEQRLEQALKLKDVQVPGELRR